MHEVKKWDAELAQFASEAVAAVPLASGDFISTLDGQLTYKGAPVPGNKLQGIILDFVRENQWFDRPYREGEPGIPVCYAFSEGPAHDEGKMRPHPGAAQPQADMCKNCPKNQWGSSPTGKGKACGNVMKLAIVPEGALESLDECPPATMKVPVMSVGNFSNYVLDLHSALKRPPFSVITEISTEPNKKSRFRVTFKHPREIASEHLEAIMEKRKTVRLAKPYPEIEAAPEPPPARGSSSRFGARK